MKTYPEMNAKIVGLLKMKDDPVSLYAAARIEELETDIQYKAEALWEAESEVKRIGRQIAKLTAELYERDLAMQNEMEALGCADDRAEQLEQALDRACKFVEDVTGNCPLGLDRDFDFDFDYCEEHCINDFAACWKKYFLGGG